MKNILEMDMKHLNSALESLREENVSLNKQIDELHKTINTYRNGCFQPGDIDYYKLTMCGMNYRQVLELKEFWMCHHEELPK